MKLLINKLKMTKIQLPVRIEQEDLNILKKLADLDNRPLSNYVDTVLKSHIAFKNLKIKL